MLLAYIRTRRIIAGKFGKMEHRMGELLGVVLWGEYLYFNDYRFLIPAIIWTIYFISHRVEKKVYGKFGYR